MSGIIGIASTRNVMPGVLQGLQQIPQTGHQHCGLVVHGQQGNTPSPPRLHRHRRAQGAAAWIQHLRDPAHAFAPSQQPCPDHSLNALHGHVALGHTGPASGTGPQALHRALPQLSHGPDAHLNSPARVAVVMHGTLQASAALREALSERDYLFKSDSAAELLAHLIDATCENDPVQALHRALALVQGPLSLGVLFHAQPECLYAMHRGQDLHAAASPTDLAWSSHPLALQPGLQALPSLAKGQVLEVHANGQSVTHRIL